MGVVELGSKFELKGGEGEKMLTSDIDIYASEDFQIPEGEETLSCDPVFDTLTEHEIYCKLEGEPVRYYRVL